MRAAWPAVADLLLGQPGSRSSLDGIVGPHRSLALVRSDLDLVKQAARAHGVTVNDVLLAVIAGGLRSLLLQRAEPIEGCPCRSTSRSRSGTGARTVRRWGT
jgi:diacylglycerol O-acyltransferase / wax synthase